MEQDIRVCVVGATGYAGVEAVRLVCGHPRLRLTMATDRTAAGTRLCELYPALLGVCDIELSYPDPSSIAQMADVVLLAVPHTASLALTPQLLSSGVSVVDLSADYRISDPAVYETWYETPHTSPDLLADAVYGLPELNRDRLRALAKRREMGMGVLVAAPGCYPTATSLAALPALEAGLVAGDQVIVAAISGVSGAGRKPSPRTHYCHANESLEAYGVARHRHTPEIEQTFSQVAGREMGVVFTPHLAPLTRGMLSTVYLELNQGVSVEQVQEVYERRYADERLVGMLPYATMPQSGSVMGTARAQVGLAVDVRRRPMLIASCAIDNLGKGAAAQAVQCANIICGLDETEGLDAPSSVV